MGFISSALGARAEADYIEKDPLSNFWYESLDFAGIGGGPLSTRTAMCISTFWKCVRWRAQQTAMLPWKLKEHVEVRGRSAERDAREHHLFPVIHSSPNPLMTSMAFIEYISHDLDTDGNFYAFIERSQSTGRIRHLWRFQPSVAEIETDSIDDAQAPGGKRWRVWYYFTDDSGERHKFYPDEILHIRALGSDDGLRGYSPIKMQMRTLGWNRATVDSSSAFMKNASRPSGLVIAENGIKDQEAKNALIDSLSMKGRKAGSLALVEGGIKYQQLTINPEEAQFIETLKYQQEDIIGLMNVKPHKVGVMEHMTNNNVEQQNIEAVTDCLQPLVTRIEQWMNLQLLSNAPSTGIGGGTERDRYFVDCELKGLLRGDMSAQTDHLDKMMDRGVYDIDDALEFLGKPAVEGGDLRVINGAYVPVDKARELADARIKKSDMRGQAGMSDENAKGFAHIFRDAVGRVLNRKPENRGKAVPQIFGRILDGLSESMGRTLPPDFASDYLGAMGKRAGAWTDDADGDVELRRAVAAVMERGAEVDYVA